MIVTVLIENTSGSGLLYEHGLSLLIRYRGKNILLDAGKTGAFYDNAKALGVPLDNLDACVLSHGHYDHSGGFEELFRHNKDVKVCAQKSAVGQYFSGSAKLHDISIPGNVLAYMDRFELIEGYKDVFPGVCLVPHNTEGLSGIGMKSKLYKKINGEMIPDDFMHEHSLVFDTDGGLVIFNSCSHGGAANIIREVKAACGNRNVYAYIGGLHMKGRRNGEEICTFTDEEVAALCDVIKDENIKAVYTGHCTGLPGLVKMKERLGDMVHALTTGLKFEIS